jgi:alpha-tubulin suppressor-like RCC1 family protein
MRRWLLAVAVICGTASIGFTAAEALPAAASPAQTQVQVRSAVTTVLAAQVSSGQWHTCALTISGGVKCWGDSHYGELGNGTTTSSAVPVNVSGLSSGVAAISARGLFTCAVTTGHGAKCWGNNNTGQLGNATTTNSSTPVGVSGLSSGVAAISAGVSHTCALTISGGVKCWGRSDDGQLGNGTYTSSAVPVNVSGLLSGVKAISAGGDLTCAVTTEGAAKCWGFNKEGALGNARTTNSSTPVGVSGLSSGVEAISVGGRHTCALTTSGGVKCWGDNHYGQLGNGGTTLSTTPVNVSGLSSGVASISAGGSHTAGGGHTCALMTSGGVKCWGDGVYGQLGNGIKKDSTTPVNVAGFGAAKACVVPKVKGRGLRAAKRAIRRHNCSVGRIKRAASRRVRKGHVVSQKPKPGKRLKRGAKVRLVVSKGRR